MALDSSGSRVLVVGASGGIGAATARAFGEAGALERAQTILFVVSNPFATDTTVTVDSGGSFA
jgi:short-subunit dehydrogenase